MKKIAFVIGILLVLILLCLGTLHFVVGWLPDPCGEKMITEAVSPDGSLKALVFERDCGATTDFSTQVAIVKGNGTLKDAGRSIFIADTDDGSAPAGPGGGPEVRLRWLSDRQLEVSHDVFAGVRRAESQAQGVEIIYAAFQ